MGTDIHLFFEKRGKWQPPSSASEASREVKSTDSGVATNTSIKDEKRADGGSDDDDDDETWHAVDSEHPAFLAFRDAFLSSESAKDFCKDIVCKECKQGQIENLIDLGRPYELFTMLAGVCSYYFRTSIVPIRVPNDRSRTTRPSVVPRGFPSDLSKKIGEVVDCCDGHSPSFYSLQELTVIDRGLQYWDKILASSAYVSANAFALWKEDIAAAEAKKRGSGRGLAPSYRCQEVSESVISIKDMERYVEDHREACQKRDMQSLFSGVFTKVKWTNKYRDNAQCLLDVCVPFLELLAQDDPSSARMVFYFDN